MKLHCYASGNGSLSFSWMEKKGNDRIATGKTVTKADVGRFFRTKDGKRLISQGFRRYNLGGRWCLARPHRRDAARGIIECGENVYSVDEENSSRISGCFAYSGLKATIHHPVLGDRELLNNSMRASLVFWLNSEEEMTKQDANRKDGKEWL